MKINIGLLVFLGSLVVSINVNAAGDPVSNVFTSGNVASSSAVNDNFQELANRISGNKSFQAQGLGPTFTSGTINYNVLGTLFGGTTTEKRTVTLAAANGLAPRALTIDREITKDDVLVAKNVLHYIVGSTGQFFAGQDISIASGVAVDNKFVIDTPLPLRLPNMKIGSSFGGESTITKKGAVSADDVVVGYVIQKVTLLDVTDVTVGTGIDTTTYVNCSKIYRERHASIALGDHTGIIWHCPGKGVVKATTIFNNVNGTTGGSSYVLEQTSFISN